MCGPIVGKLMIVNFLPLIQIENYFFIQKYATGIFFLKTISIFFMVVRFFAFWMDIEYIHWGLVLHVWVKELGCHWFKWCLVVWLVASHYLNRCWVIVNCTLKHEHQWNLGQNILLLMKNIMARNCKIIPLFYFHRTQNMTTEIRKYLPQIPVLFNLITFIVWKVSDFYQQWSKLSTSLNQWI